MSNFLEVQMGKYGKGDTSWFTHDRFGMFIVWGLYSMAARHEWVRNFEQMSGHPCLLLPSHSRRGCQWNGRTVFRRVLRLDTRTSSGKIMMCRLGVTCFLTVIYCQYRLNIMKIHILPAIIAIFSGLTLLADATPVNLLKDTAFDAMPDASAWNYAGQPGWAVEKGQDGIRALVKRREKVTGESDKFIIQRRKK